MRAGGSRRPLVALRMLNTLVDGLRDPNAPRRRLGLASALAQK